MPCLVLKIEAEVTGEYQGTAADSLSSCEVALSVLNVCLTLPTFKVGLILFTNLSMATQFTETQFCLEKGHVTLNALFWFQQ